MTGCDSADTAVPTVVAHPPASVELRTTGADDTRRMAGVMATVCIPGDVVLLAGDLGAGKTTFAQGFAAGLGVAEPVTSPTFTLVRQYVVAPLASPTDVPDQQGSGQPIRTLIHADVYRLDHLNEIVDLGLGELVEDSAVALVEWGDVAEPILGEGSLAIGLTPGPDDGDTQRVITVSPRGDTWTGRWEIMVEVLASWRSEE